LMLPVIPISEGGTSMPHFCCKHVTCHKHELMSTIMNGRHETTIQTKQQYTQNDVGALRTERRGVRGTLMAAAISSADTDPNNRPSSPAALSVTIVQCEKQRTSRLQQQLCRTRAQRTTIAATGRRGAGGAKQVSCLQFETEIWLQFETEYTARTLSTASAARRFSIAAASSPCRRSGPSAPACLPRYLRV
jgi:hypothetical protein